VEFRFNSKPIFTGSIEDRMQEHIDRWRRTCNAFPDRVVWGTDLFSWEDLDPCAFSNGIHVWGHLVSELYAGVREMVSGGNMARTLKPD